MVPSIIHLHVPSHQTASRLRVDLFSGIGTRSLPTDRPTDRPSDRTRPVTAGRLHCKNIRISTDILWRLFHILMDSSIRHTDISRILFIRYTERRGSKTAAMQPRLNLSTVVNFQPTCSV